MGKGLKKRTNYFLIFQLESERLNHFIFLFVAASVCYPSPCRNGGNCTINGNGFYNCSCPHGIGGQNCTEGTWNLYSDDSYISSCPQGIERHIYTAVLTVRDHKEL